jgi:hypothetical protein
LFNNLITTFIFQKSLKIRRQQLYLERKGDENMSKNESIKVISVEIILLILIASFVPSINGDAKETFYVSNNFDCGLTLLNDGPEEEWNVTFGGNRYDVFFGVEETADNGFIAIGGRDATSWDMGGDCWLVKTDANGNMQWDRTFGGGKTDNGHGILQTTDGGFIISAITESYGAGSADAWVIKTDSSGNELWNKTYGGNYYDLAEKTIPQTNDDGFLIVGSTISFGTEGSRDGWLIKIDTDGSEQWNKTYGTKDSEHFWEVHITADGGYIMIGYVDNSSTNRRDAWVVKTDSNGDLLWDKKFGPANQGLSIIQTNDDGFLLLAEVKDTVFGGYLNAWMVKINEYGNEEWNKMFITPQGEDRFAVHHNIQRTQDNEYILTGVTNAKLPVYSTGDMWLTKTDANGNILWEKIIGGSEYDTTYTVDVTSDGGFISAGMTKSFGTGDNFNAWLVKISDYENQRPNKPEKPDGDTTGKPGTEYTYSSLATDPDGESLYYIWDWGDGNYSYWLGPYESGENAEATYVWEIKGEYNIRVKVKDINGGESDWSDPLTVSMPKGKQLVNTLYLKLLGPILNIFTMLKTLLFRILPILSFYF